MGTPLSFPHFVNTFHGSKHFWGLQHLETTIIEPNFKEPAHSFTSCSLAMKAPVQPYTSGSSLRLSNIESVFFRGKHSHGGGVSGGGGGGGEGGR